MLKAESGALAFVGGRDLLQKRQLMGEVLWTGSKGERGSR